MPQPLLKALLCALPFLLLLELYARAEDSLRWGAPFAGHYHLEGIRGVDDRGTVRCAPNARYKHFELGEHGFRTTVHRSTGDRSLVWLGASEAFGLYESPGQDVANQLEARLERAGHGIDVVNASCFGLNVTRMTRLVEAPIAGLQPDYLALYPTPHFYLDQQEVAPDQPRQGSAGAGGFQSRLVAKSRDALKSFLPAALQDAMRGFQVQRAIAGASEGWLWRTPPDDRLALFEAHTRALLEAARATRARVALLTHANAFTGHAEPDASILTAWQKFYPRATGSVLIDFDQAANAVLRRLAAEYDVTLIDVAELVAGDAGYFADFSHFTDAGATRVAEALADWVHRTSPVAARAASGGG